MRAGSSSLPLGGARQRSVLAFLLLHANEVVSSDLLVEEIWDGEPPGSAATNLQGYVSQLRKVLEPDRPPGAEPRVLLTRARGYLLRVGLGELDLDRAERRAAEGRELLAGGHPSGAAECLRAALAEWRGRALADLADQPFAVEAARRLEERREAVLEDLFEAELARGHHREMVPELQEAIAAHPLRERPRGQLMLALYRSDRQADALQAYRDYRSELVEELGLEPNRSLRELEERILAQDPALAAPAPARRAAPSSVPDPDPAARRDGRRTAAVLLGGAAVAALAVVAIASGGGDDNAVRVSGNAIAAIDPSSNAVAATVPLGGTPTAVSVAAGNVWALNADDQTISRIEARSRTVTTFGTGATPTDLAAGAGAVWVGDHARIAGAQYVGPIATGIARVEPASRVVSQRIELPRPRGALSNAVENHIAVTSEAVWVVNPDFTVSRIDPRTNRLVARVGDIGAVAIAAGTGGVWALGSDGTIARIDADTNRVTRRIHIATTAATGLAVGGGSVWVTDSYEGTLWRIDPSPRLLMRTIPVGAGVSAVAYGAGAVWVVNGLNGSVLRVDPRANRVAATVRLGGTPRGIAVGAGSVWVTVAAAEPANATAGRLSLPVGESACGAVYYGGPGKPNAVIVSDFPLHAAPAAPTLAMSQAVAYVLRQRGFRAGRLRIGYRACDDSTAQSGIYDPSKCLANAKTWVADRKVIGVVGPYNSGCALQEIPIAAAAPGGPLAMISPTSSTVDLTRVGNATPRGALARLYPGGHRNYARLYPPDDTQVSAAAIFMRQLGLRRVFLLNDASGYGADLAAWFHRAARKVGLPLAGAATWGRDGPPFATLARRVRAARADGVLLSALIDTGAPQAIVALRRELGPRLPIVATEGVLPVSLLYRNAGAMARGIYVSVAARPVETLGAEGRRFVDAFGSTQPRHHVDPVAVYAAQATGMLLDAIARSDGSRAGVTTALLHARPARGPMGTVGIDLTGDPTPAPVTIVRVRHGGGAGALGSADGAAVVRVIPRPPRLAR